MATQFSINGSAASSNAPADTPLLWVIREQLTLTGTKFGCGAGLCGPCMVDIDALGELRSRAYTGHGRSGELPVTRWAGV